MVTGYSENVAPVVVFVYKRLEHTIRTLNSLNKNYLVDKTNLYIFSDNYRNELDKEDVNLVRKYICNFSEKSKFKKVTVIKADKNIGLAKSIIRGVTQIINKYGRAIIVEDDIVTSTDFLKFMNDTLSYYESDNRIWSISGYTLYQKRWKQICKEDVFLFYRGSSWGWATWKDRWELTDWNVNDYIEFKKNITMREQFARGGEDLPFLLDSQMEGKIDSWSIKFDYQESKFNALTVYPKNAKAINIGCDGSGIHCWDDKDMVKQKIPKEMPYKLIPLEINLKLVKRCQDIYKTGRNSPFKDLRDIMLKIKFQIWGRSF